MRLLSWGANSHGQLGQGETSEEVLTPQPVTVSHFRITDIDQIVGGGGHTIIKTKSGRLYACGWNLDGQLGIGLITENINNNNFIPVQFDIAVKGFACGWASSCAWTESGRLFVWGSNRQDLIGYSCEIAKILAPMECESLPDKVVQAGFGLFFMACLLRCRKKIVVFGAIKKVDIFERVNYGKVPALVYNSSEIIEHMACGQNNFLVATASGIRGVGENKFQQCMEYVPSAKVRQLKCGWTNTGVLSEDGKIVMWGRNSYGQCGTVSEGNSVEPTELVVDEKAAELYLGAEHGLFVSKSRDVYTWGWNEHGNCGNNSRENLFSCEKLKFNGKCIIAGTGAGFCYALIDETE